MNKEEWEDYKNLSGEITDKLDNTGTYESWIIIQEYVDRCQEKNKKYKEVIDGAIQFIKDTCIEQIPDMPQGVYRETASIGDLEQLLAILEGKEVE